jgi:hypothetical protein
VALFLTICADFQPIFWQFFKLGHLFQPDFGLFFYFGHLFKPNFWLFFIWAFI